MQKPAAWLFKMLINAAANQPEVCTVFTSADCQSPGTQWPIAVPEGRTDPKSIPRLKTPGETWDRSCNVYRRRYAHATQALFVG